MPICLQIHNDYLIPGGETKSTKLIADLLEANGIKVIRYYKDNHSLNQINAIQKVMYGIKSVYNIDVEKEIEKIICEQHIDFALVHNTSPLISNSVYAALIKNRIPIYKYLQNYNILCLNGSLNEEEKCIYCQKNSLIGIKNKCYKNSVMYTTQKAISRFMLRKKYLQHFTGFIAISEYVKQRHIEFGIPAHKIHVLYHFCENIETIAQDTHDSQRYYVYMGRLSKEKGVLTMIKAFENIPNVSLKVMGNGELADELNNYINNRGIQNVEMLGFKKGKEKDEIVRGAVALIAPSEWDEPFGRIAIEAYQVGTPVLTSGQGGLGELVIEGETGYGFECGNSDDLKCKIEIMESMSSNDYRIMRRNCIQIVEDKFSKNAYMAKFIKIINGEEED